jgi:hypothetical protein
MLLVACAALFAVAGAQAVHDLSFQLDGDVAAGPATHIGTGTQSVDWASLFNASGTPGALPAGFTASSFTRDFGLDPGCSLTAATGTFCTSDTTTYATGSKDTLSITPGWQCSFSSNVNSKIDIMNAYAASFTDPSTSHKIMYFALERNTNTGDGNVGFWFLQSSASCAAASGNAPFVGHHTDGDLLIVSAFTKGGGVSGINAYRWNGDDATGSLGTNPIGSGGDCQGATGLDAICATTNGSAPPNLNGPITTPWLTSNKADGVGHTLQASEFFEGGVDLTTEHLDTECFQTFIGDTRSSQSLTATLFDFAGGTLGSCSSGVVTTPSAGQNGTVSIGAGASLSETDSALITTVGAATFGGTVKFYLCGPLASNSTSNCSTGGVQIGTPSTGETVTGAAGTATVGSDTATVTKVGRYCWRAEYSGDSVKGVPASSDPAATDTTSLTECFTVTPLTPTLPTSATGSVLLGTAIDDTATLTGTANQPGTGGLGTGGTINPTTAGVAAGGTITFSLYGPSATSVCTAANLIGTSVVTVSGDAAYTASSGTVTGTLTPTAVGTYRWIAIYSPDSSGNTLAPNPAGACGDTGEVSIITGAASLSTTQNWLPNDTAHITSPAGTTLGGTVTFTLYNDGSCGTGGGSSQYTSGALAIPGTSSGTANDRTISTANTTFKVTTANDAVAWSWKVLYDDTNLTDPSFVCETTTPAFTLSD